VTQLGTMAAVVLFFRADLLRITRAWLRSVSTCRRPVDLDGRLGWYIVLGTIPIAVFGLLFRHQIENGARSLFLIGVSMISLGLLLLLAERVGSRARGVESLRLRDGMVVGLAQAAAVVPGVSRSGATITGGLFLGLDRPAAARFSFLLSVPAVVLSGALEMLSLAQDGMGGTSPARLVLATALAFVVGYASIAFLMRFLESNSTAVFVAYRVGLGLLVLTLAGAGLIS
jgi:undecaprenyl-diphosphatase